MRILAAMRWGRMASLLLVSGFFWDCASSRPDRGGYMRETGSHDAAPPAKTKPKPAIAAAAFARPDPGGKSETGIISFYGGAFHGRKTASGERFNQHELTAAHRTLPFGTRVKVTHLGNGRSVVVRVNDRGPWTRGRILDVSKAAAEKLAMVGQGTAKARVEVLD